MKKTTNLQLNKPDTTDFYDIAIQNENMDIIDEKITELKNNKAEKSHTHIKSQVGLENVDNTSDLEKPVSVPQQTALDEVEDRSTISNTVIGERITVTNSTNALVRTLKVNGRTEQLGEPSPDYPQDIVGVNKVEITVTGKNLCSGYKVGAYKNGDGVYVRDYAHYRCTELIEVSEGINYVESNGLGMNVSDVHHFDENKKWLSSISSKNINNRPSGTKYIVLNYLTSDDLKWVQVEEGTVATTFEEYKSQTAKIPVDSPLYDGDSVTLKNGEWSMFRKMTLIDLGTLNYEVDDVSKGLFKSQFYEGVSPKNNSTVANIKCTHYIPMYYYDTGVGTVSKNGTIAYNENAVYIHDEKCANYSTTDFKNYMSGKYMLYELAEPTTEVIETDIDLSTYCNVTNITNSENANMEVEYFVNNTNGNVVADLYEEVRRLKKLILESN